MSLLRRLCRFCNGLKCPEFKTVKLYDTYAEREYKNSTWAYTKISSLVMEPAQLRGFKVRWLASCDWVAVSMLR